MATDYQFGYYNQVGNVEPDLTPLWFLINAWQETKQPAFDLVGKINGEVLRLVSEALAAARVQENEKITYWYYNEGHRLAVFEVAPAIRALITDKDQ